MEAAGLRGSAVGVATITAAGPVFEGRDSRGHILSCISRKQRKAGRENSSFKEEHCCLTSLGRKFEELHPKLRAGWRGASEV